MKFISFFAFFLSIITCCTSYGNENKYVFVGQNGNDGRAKTAFVLELLEDDLEQHVQISDNGEVYLKADKIVSVPKGACPHSANLAGGHSQGTLLGKPAPEFVAKAVVNGEIVDNFSLKDFIGQYVVLFFYPLDFTFVCPTELHAFQERLAEFQQRNAQVVACSVDSCFSHSAWLNTPKNKGGIEGVEYPLVSDLNKTISKAYQVLQEEDGIAYRGLFLIDRQGVIRHLLVNDLPLGRSVDEALRLVDALNYVEEHGEVCPANWQTGSKAMKPTAEGLVQYFE